jgi:hypothetical protein
MSQRSGKKVEKALVTRDVVRTDEVGQSSASGLQQSILALQHSAGNRAVTNLLKRSSGRPLNPRIREEMEAKFGEDFRDVRVHGDRTAHTIASLLGARALTSGKEIVFGEDFYVPNSSKGKRLLAHELAHVVQQRRGRGSSSSEGVAEDEARTVGTNVESGKSARVASSAGTGAQLDPLNDDERKRETESMLPPELVSSIKAMTTPVAQPGIAGQPMATSAPAAPPAITHWLGNPATQPRMQISQDARGNITVDSPETGRTTFSASGKRLTPLPNGDAENIARTLRAMNYLHQTGGKRVVEGKGALDEAGWKQHIEERKRLLGAEVERDFSSLSEGERLFHETQTGAALAAAVPAHALGGRRLNDSQQIVSSARQDIQIAKHQMDTARTPEELAEAEHHLQFVVGNAEAHFTRYKEDVYGGAENTITGIKVGAAVAVSGAALATPALLAAGGAVTAKTVGFGALGGGAFSAARQVAEKHEGTRKDYSVEEVGWGMAGGAVLSVVPGAAPLLMGPAVASSADELSQGHVLTGAVDAAGALAPIGAAKAAQPGTGRAVANYLGPRAAALLMQGVENVPGLGGHSPTVNIPYEAPVTPQAAVPKAVAAPRAAASVSAPVVAEQAPVPSSASSTAAAGAPTPVQASPTAAPGVIAVSQSAGAPATGHILSQLTDASAQPVLRVIRLKPQNDVRLPYPHEQFEDSAAKKSAEENQVPTTVLGTGEFANPRSAGLDLASKKELTQVKAYTGSSAESRVLKDLKKLSGIDAIGPGQSQAEKAAADMETLKQRMAAMGQTLELPPGYDANPAEFIRQNTVFRIPDDLVDPVRHKLIAEVMDPHAYENYGLPGPLSRDAAEKYAARRIRTGGMAQGQLK